MYLSIDLKYPYGNDWDMAKIWSAGVFAPPPESSAQDPPWIGLRFRCFKIAQNPSNDVQLIKIGHNG